MRRVLLAPAAIVLSVAAATAQTEIAGPPVATTPPADPALVEKIGAWVETYGFDIPEIVRGYGRACFTDAIGSSPPEVQAFLLAEPDLDDALRRLDNVFEPRVYGRVAPRLDNCGGVVAIATMIATEVEASYAAASAAAKDARVICMTNAIVGLPIESKETIYSGDTFTRGLAALARENAEFATELQGQIALCPTPPVLGLPPG